MVQDQITAEALALFRQLPEDDQLRFLEHLRSLLAGQGSASADLP